MSQMLFIILILKFMSVVDHFFVRCCCQIESLDDKEHEIRLPSEKSIPEKNEKEPVKVYRKNVYEVPIPKVHLIRVKSKNHSDFLEEDVRPESEFITASEIITEKGESKSSIFLSPQRDPQDFPLKSLSIHEYYNIA